MNEYRVLVVDDDEDTLSLYKDILIGAAYDVATAHNGEKALEILDQFDPDILLLDVHMPGINGLETCREIRKRSGYEYGGDKRIIMFSGKAQSEPDAEKGLRLADTYEPRRPTSSGLILALVCAAAREIDKKHPYWIIDERFHLAREKPEMLVNSVTRRLNPLQYELLKYLCQRLNKSCRRDAVVDAINIAPSTLSKDISELRALIEPDREHPQYLVTYPGQVMLQPPAHHG